VVSLFLWQACNNVLPTKENLFKKKITSDPSVPSVFAGSGDSRICLVELFRCKRCLDGDEPQNSKKH
jgi:hypothetical protein